jgi:restriction system protein
MARRKDSTLKDIMDITAMLPWWVGICLAVVSYLALHFVAGLQVEKVVGLETMGPYFVKQLIISISGYLQFIFPAIFVFGAIGSVIQSKKKAKLYDRLKQSPAIQTLNEMNWQQFELLVGKYFEEKGYTVRQLALPGADGGVDLVVIKDGEQYLVQCKQWRSTSVGVKVVRELLGVITANGAVGGFVVASGQFTSSAKDFVQGRNIELIDGAKIVSTIDIDTDAVSSKAIQPDDENPRCPRCSANMVRRTARQGANAGNKFWGCSTYPKCKGIVS